MAKVKINDNIYIIDDRIWIERGIAIKRGVVATPGTLAKLHPHYSVPHEAFDNHPVHKDNCKRRAFDATGRDISHLLPPRKVFVGESLVDHSSVPPGTAPASIPHVAIARLEGFAMDQTGAPIVMGQPFSYVDHPIAPDSFPNHPGAAGSFSWFVFRLDDDPTVVMHKSDDEVKLVDGAWTVTGKSPPVPDPTHPMHGKRLVEYGQYPTLEAAESFAAKI